MTKFFYCYNKNLSRYIKNKGIRYVLHGTNKNSGNDYVLYERTHELSSAIDEWQKLQNK
ncbi:hypothetical protein DOK78_002380 [Enterococcus sp. DIV2402]|uniref:DUF5659 domain-containing protein n=1 Tax=Candidatus Enterococcus lowellii TaxID=2230877 RepID=A0ABZ2SQD7_9ENTE|nr:hypothetical protein [Enterococcus sp. DIV2402]MBO0463500.1 hypothetical protein [Enterococcus sp. DIV2402]